MSVFHLKLPFQYSNMLKMRVAPVKSQNYNHFTDLLTPFFTAHLGHFGPCHGRGTINICTKTVVEIASAGAVGHNPEIARKKTIRVTDECPMLCVFLGCSSQRWNWDSTSWRSTMPLLSLFWEKGFPTPRALYQPPNLQDRLKIKYCLRWLEALRSGVKSQWVNFET